VVRYLLALLRRQQLPGLPAASRQEAALVDPESSPGSTVQGLCASHCGSGGCHLQRARIRNPWIDPRVVQVRSADAQAYLLLHGWKQLPTEQPNLLPFEGPSGGEEIPMVQVPMLEQARDYPQRVIELLTDLALAEGRYAVDVLNDLLQQSRISAASVNGPDPAGQAEPVRP
jgi:hypothetical protein